MAKTKKKDSNTADVGFEQMIWAAADKLRGNIDPSEYKGVVLGLVFLKYLSDHFEDQHAKLVAEGEGFEEDIDAYTSENVFWVPVNARWNVISNAAHTPEIGKTIDAAMRAIEESNPRLKNILPKDFSRQELDQRRLGEVVDLFTNVDMVSHSGEKDLLGRTYEYCLQMFASQEGKNGGEFYTPSCIVRTLVEVIQPYKGRVYDPCCGSGGMFVQSAKFVKNHSGNIDDLSVYGQESNPTTWKLAVMNLAIRGIDANLGKYNADSFFDDLHKSERFDFILANPPFNVSDWGGDRLTDDPRWEYGIPPAGNANFAWLQHMIHHLSSKGRIGLVLANGALSSNTSNEGVIRKNIVEADLVEGIIAMPSQLFYGTQIPASLWILSKQKAQPNKVLFVDARNLGTMVTRKNRELFPKDISRISTAFDLFRKGEAVEEKGFSAVATLENIKEQDYILTPGRYVGIAEQEEDTEPFDEKMKRLTSELSNLFKESNALEQKIKDNLKSIGYEL